ncbi:hypothetical protein GOP47_0012021 [Adiantum capillus-veneris]|uniref:Ribosomal protein L7/L12 C-terminal domain-containing protein n=1 Tax=Adiantum capillus-veneris TaxID=13818 RepID=A0A9D4UTW4_ADICA|nr:hypothetical protein GOP47_0012021 [Adiantum capillus-veneris]
MSRLFGRARLYISTASKGLSYPALPAVFQDAGACTPSQTLPSCTPPYAELSVFFKNLHTTTHKKGAATKLKEVAVDNSDYIDTPKPADYNPSSFDPQESRSPPADKIIRIVDEIAHLTMIEAADLAHLLKKKLGLPDSAMPYYGGGMGAGTATAQGAQSPAAQEEKAPEKTNFDVKLEKFDAASKIKIIKEVRTFTTLGLKEAKELVEKLPAVLKAGVAKEEAEKIVEKLKAVGATCVLE